MIPSGDVSNGGTATLVYTPAAPAVLLGRPCRLCRFLVTATGTTNLAIYDNNNAASGTIIGVIPSTATVGQVFDFQMPASLGLFTNGATTAPAGTVSVA